MEIIDVDLPLKERAIIPISDIHYGIEACDLEKLQEFIDLGLRLDARFLGLGDAFEFCSPSNRERLRAAQLHETADDLINKMANEHLLGLIEVLKKTTGKWLGFMRSDHTWIFPDGSTLDTRLAEAMKAPFLGDTALIRIRLKDRKRETSFTIFAAHGVGGGLTVAGPLNRLRNLAACIHADVFVTGHTHQKVVQPMPYISLLPDAPKLQERSRLLVVAGSFLKGYLEGSREEFTGQARGCVPMSTEILTKRGFKLSRELVIGEDVLGYDIQTNSCKWTTLRATNVFYGKAPLLKINDNRRGLKAICTPEHRWLHLSQEAKNPKLDLKNLSWKQAKDLRRGSLLVSAPLEEMLGEKSVLNEREAAILGWIVTDGWFYPWKAQTGIVQKKPQYVTEIRSLLGSDCTEYTGAAGMTHFMIPLRFGDLLFAKAGVEPRTYNGLSKLVCDLDASARRAMKAAMEHAEGHQEEKGWRFSQKNEEVLKAWEILCILAGERLGVLGKDLSSGVYSRRCREARTATLRSHYRKDRRGTALLEDAGYVDTVWCPTTDLGSWVMRQDNGTIAITGNSYIERSLLTPVTLGSVVILATPRTSKRDGSLNLDLRGLLG